MTGAGECSVKENETNYSRIFLQESVAITDKYAIEEINLPCC